MLIDGPDNLEAYWRMIEAIRSEESFGFAGAGVSRPLGYPTWSQLLDQLAQETRTTCGEAIVDNQDKPITVKEVEGVANLLVRAEIFKWNLKDRYASLLAAAFAPKKAVTADIKQVARLPFQHLLTCNYDTALETAHQDLQLEAESICLCDGTAREFVNKLFRPEYKKRIVHVHGRFDKPESIVLTESEYAALYGDSRVVKFWGTVPMYKSCIFFGFSFTDEDITEKFNLGNFNRAQRDGSETPHFALLALADKDRDKERVLRTTYKIQYGIDPVFFDSVDLTFSGYSELIERISRDVPPRTRQASVRQPDLPTLANDVAQLEALTIMNVKKGATGEFR